MAEAMATPPREDFTSPARKFQRMRQLVREPYFEEAAGAGGLETAAGSRTPEREAAARSAATTTSSGNSDGPWAAAATSPVSPLPPSRAGSPDEASTPQKPLITTKPASLSKPTSPSPVSPSAPAPAKSHHKEHSSKHPHWKHKAVKVAVEVAGARHSKEHSGSKEHSPKQEPGYKEHSNNNKPAKRARSPEAEERRRCKLEAREAERATAKEQQQQQQRQQRSSKSPSSDQHSPNHSSANKEQAVAAALSFANKAKAESVKESVVSAVSAKEELSAGNEKSINDKKPAEESSNGADATKTRPASSWTSAPSAGPTAGRPAPEAAVTSPGRPAAAMAPAAARSTHVRGEERGVGVGAAAAKSPCRSPSEGSEARREEWRPASTTASGSDRAVVVATTAEEDEEAAAASPTESSPAPAEHIKTEDPVTVRIRFSPKKLFTQAAPADRQKERKRELDLIPERSASPSERTREGTPCGPPRSCDP
eukprot:1152809-Prorocentrum_minimum.AAC.1